MKTKSIPARAEKHRIDGIPVVLHRKPGRKIWSARITLPPYEDGRTVGKDGNRVDRGTSEADLEKAKIAAHRIYANLTEKVVSGKSIAAKAFDEVVAEYLVQLNTQIAEGGRRVIPQGKIRQSAYDAINTALTRYYVPFFGDRGISSISNLDLAKHHDWRMNYASNYTGEDKITYERNGQFISRPFVAINPSVDYLRNERVRFYGLMEFAWEQGYIQQDATPRYKALKGGGNTRLAFSQENMRAIQEVSAERIRAISHSRHKRQRILLHYRMLFIYLTGCRPQEIARLIFGDLIPGKDKAGEYSYLVDLKEDHLKNPDNKVHKRKVTPQRGFGLLIENIKALYHEFDGTEAKETDYIFHNADRSVINKVSKTMKALTDAAGFSGSQYTQYSFRHTFINERLYERQEAHFVSRWV